MLSESSVWRNCHSHEVTAARYTGSKTRLSLGTSNLYSAATTLTDHWQPSLSRAVFNYFSWPMQKLRQKKKNQCKKWNIEVANTNGRLVNFQTILIQDHCTHLSCFPQKPKQLTASKPLLPQQTVQTDQDNQDIDTKKILIGIFVYLLPPYQLKIPLWSSNTKS